MINANKNCSNVKVQQSKYRPMKQSDFIGQDVWHSQLTGQELLPCLYHICMEVSPCFKLF